MTVSKYDFMRRMKVMPFVLMFVDIPGLELHVPLYSSYGLRRNSKPSSAHRRSPTASRVPDLKTSRVPWGGGMSGCERSWHVSPPEVAEHPSGCTYMFA